MPQKVFHEVMNQLYRMGVLDVVLPFMFLFVIIYAALVKTGILHHRDRVNKAYDVTVAVIIALLGVTPHVIFGTPMPDGRLGGVLFGFPDVVEIMNNALPSITIWILALMMVMFLTGMFGLENLQERYGKWVLGLAVIIVIYIFGNAAGIFGAMPSYLGFLNDDDNKLFLLILFIFAIVIYFIVGGRRRATQQPEPQPERPDQPGREDVPGPGSR
ncbi:prominin family protein [Candidatus Woesearchaeota archaeon]|nr:prominin family protein [Candidatus Woesearchaeota archaeon]